MINTCFFSITDSGPRSENETTYYDITEIFEMGKMASLFFNKTGRIAFYLCLTIYLYGDLAIYGAAVAKSLRFVNGDIQVWKVELVSKELNHLAAILHVYAGGLIFMR